MGLTAYLGAEIFDGDALVRDTALLRDGARCGGVVGIEDLPRACRQVRLQGGTLMPGFVDLQVNGGGGVMLNDAPTVEGVTRIAAAHARSGTRALLPTLITDTPARSAAAIAAVTEAIAQGVPGILGLHLEGPHLSVARKGAHDPALIRPMTDADEALLIDAAARLPNLMVTLAPEAVPPARIRRLAAAGVIVALGHSDCGIEAAREAFAAGARCVTHLYNAMSQLGSRAPGLVGAALGTPGVRAGLIADAVHVHPVAMGVAVAAKGPEAGLFLVTDAMAPAGTDMSEFALTGRRVLRRDGRLTLEDGTLAGADLDMPRAISVLIHEVGVARHTALAMATSWPAGVLRDPRGFGRLEAGQPWNAIHLDAAGRFQPLAD